MHRRPQPHAFWGVDAEGRATSEPAEFVLVVVALTLGVYLLAEGIFGRVDSLAS